MTSLSMAVPRVHADDNNDCLGVGAPTWNASRAAYAISSREEFEFIGTESDCLDNSFYLTTDLDFSAAFWEPIDSFAGRFDGRNKTITGLTLTGSESGLFNTNAGAEIVDLRLEDVSVDVGDPFDDKNIGSVVGFSLGSLTIDNVHASGDLVALNNVGGLVGYSLGMVNVNSSSVEGDVTATAEDDFILAGTAGGLIGLAAGGATITDSSYDGDISAWTHAGGLVGEVVNDFLTIHDSDVTGSITGTMTDEFTSTGFAGGLAGLAANGALVTGSSLDGDVEAWSYAGGLVGEVVNDFLTIEDSEASGSVVGHADDGSIWGSVAGGLVGAATMGASVSGSSFDGDVEAWSYAGGLVGEVVNDFLTIEDSDASGSVTALADGGILNDGYAGGLIGAATMGASVTGSSFDGDVEASTYVGGLVGETVNDFLTIEDSDASGSVTATLTEDGPSYAGGLVGIATSGVLISGALFDGDVEALTYAGGLIGDVANEVATVEDSSATGTVTSTDDGDSMWEGAAGGLLGIATSGASVSGVSFDGDVEARQWAGGLIGQVFNEFVTIEDSDASGTVTANLVDESHEDGVAGGLIGIASFGASVSGSSFEGDVVAWTHAGGLVAYLPNQGLTVSESYAAGTVTALSDADLYEDSFAGGLSGFSSGGIAGTNVYFVGNVVSQLVAGGLLGYTNGAVSLTSSFASGSVSVTGDVGFGAPLGTGGLVGATLSDVEVTDGFFNGDVEGTEGAGGLIGTATGGDIDLIRTYSVGSVVDNDDPGVADLVGISIAAPTITSSFCVHAARCSDATRITASELSSRRFFSSEGWDLRTVWCFTSGRNDGYPMLRSITFGPLDSGCARRTGGSRRRVVFDPAGGSCSVNGVPTTRPWLVGFRGSTSLPAAGSCERAGYTLIGWTQDPGSTSPVSLVESTVRRSGRLTAVWTKTPGAPVFIGALRDFLCRDCGTALVIWRVAGDDATTIDAQVSVDGVVVPCSPFALVDWRLCGVTGLMTGQSHTIEVRLRTNGATGEPAVVAV